MKEEPKSVGAFIQQLLEAKELDLNMLSRGCGISLEHLELLVAGECMLTGEVVIRLAGYLDWPAVEFLDVQRAYLIGMREQQDEGVMPA